MSWICANRLNLDRTVHTVPVRDLITHDYSPGCICRPKVIRYLNGNAQIVHNSLDGREANE